MKVGFIRFVHERHSTLQCMTAVIRNEEEVNKLT